MPSLALDDGTLSYDQTGSGPPLVLVHGGWQDATAWRRQVEHFAEDYRVVTFDLRGHGETGATGARRYSVDLFVDDLERLLEHLDVERPTLGGVSIGGMVIQSYLAANPDGAAAAVVGGPLQSVAPLALPPALKSVASPLPAITGMVSAVGPVATFRWFLGAMAVANGGPWLSVDPAVRSGAMDAVEGFTGREYLKVFRALYEFEPRDLSGVRTPTLVLYGDRELPAVKRQGEHLAASLPNGAYREIPDAGHLVNQDNPRAFNAACSAFFAEAGRPEPVGR